MEAINSFISIENIISLLNGMLVSTLCAYVGCKVISRPIGFKFAVLIGVISTLAGLIPVIGFIANALVFLVSLYYLAGIEVRDLGLLYLVNMGIYYLTTMLKEEAIRAGWLNF